MPSIFSSAILSKICSLWVKSEVATQCKGHSLSWNWKKEAESIFLKTSESENEIVYTLQSWTKYLEKSKEIKENWTREKKIENCFCIVFYLYYRSSISGMETGH